MESRVKDKTVRVARFLVLGVDGDQQATTEARQRWAELGVAVQRITNDFYAHWLRLQIESGGQQAVRRYIADTLAWHAGDAATRGSKPKCPVAALPKEMYNQLYAILSRDHPGINIRSLVLALNKLQGDLKTHKASHGSFPRWMVILDGRGELPSMSRTGTIPFDKMNGSLIVPPKNGDGWQFQLRVDRIPRDGKPATSTIDRLRLKTGGKNLHSLRHCLQQIHDGLWKFAGSDLVKKEDGWYIHLCYQMPAQPKADVDTNKKAYLRPGRHVPLVLRIAGYSYKLRKDGSKIAYLRRGLAAMWQSRSNAYRHASSSRSGHGRKRALAWQPKLTARWQHAVATWNGQSASEVVKMLVRRGIGSLVFFQAKDAWRETRFLATAGKSARDHRIWDWYKLGSALAAECQENGIAMVSEEHKYHGSRRDTTTQSKGRKRVRQRQV